MSIAAPATYATSIERREAVVSLSTKPIPPAERLICALDMPSEADALALVDRLGDHVLFYKLGLELMMSGRYFPLIDALVERGKKIFADLKFFDVPNTVQAAVAQLARHKVEFATVHGNDAILRAAAAAKGPLKILAVTVLTSLDEGDMTDLGFAADIKSVVLSRAKRALSLGCDGVISSGIEVPDLREVHGDKFLIVVPGIRPGANTEDDQKRTVNVTQAFERGADHIVVGRPIRLAADPAAMAASIQAEIAGLFGATSRYKTG